MSSFGHPIIGQEAVVPDHGLGRVESYKDNSPELYIEVKPYILGYSLKFAPENVRLVKINFYEI